MNQEDPSTQHMGCCFRRLPGLDSDCKSVGVVLLDSWLNKLFGSILEPTLEVGKQALGYIVPFHRPQDLDGALAVDICPTDFLQ